jgi:signal transduction histidine kinase
LQRRLQAAPAAGAAQNILERFESATFRRLVDRLPHGVLWVGENQCITYANAAGAAILGRPDGLVGAALAEVVDNPAVVQTAVAARARAASGLSVDHTRGSGEQESTLRFRAVALADQAGGGDVLITIEDISQLRESQRARDNFLYHVTHELRTPLTNIHAYAETLTKPGFDDEQTRKECYNVLISETQRLARLVEDILSISQMEVGTARFDVGDVDLLRLLRQMVQDNLGAADEKRIDLTLSLPPKVPKIRGDKQRLCVLLNNLIGNAIKYTREGGKVQVALEVAENCVRIGVTDTGIGIAPADQAHVFEKFYRAADDAVQAITGTGLGLALAQEVARLHGGEIHLRVGPRFDVHGGAAHAGRGAWASRPRAGGGDDAMSRVLVVEDDPHILRLISMWLERQGHDVREARNGLAARELLRAEPTDVLVTDVNMPGLDGLALIEAALAMGHVRRGIVVLTNRWDHGEIRDRLAQWHVHVLPKPFSPARLSELVDSLATAKDGDSPSSVVASEPRPSGSG